MSIYNSARWSDDSQNGILLISDDNPPFYVDNGPLYEKAISGGFGVISDAIIQGQTSEDVRSYRNELLAASDWTQVADAPVDQAAWATYRQALRDIPEQEGFPGEIAWPAQP